ncbi:MAG: hypothetical protein Q9203_007168 [Teloschistes exilis]
MAMVEEKTTQPSATEEKSPVPSFSDEAPSPELGVNVSGHKQELQRNFGLLSLCGMGLTSGNVWMALGGTIVRFTVQHLPMLPSCLPWALPQTVAIYNGGPPGVIYEYIAASVFYWIIGASIAELASAIPSSGGVYHWATITAGRYGRVCGWFAGWWNCLAWLLALAAQLQIVAAQSVSMYAVMHDGFETARWQVFVTYIILAWIACFTVLYMNRTLPSIQMFGGFLVIAGVFVTIVLCAVLPHVTHKGYATNHSVWEDWQNETGYESNGFVFLLGMLNGAYAVGTPDLLAHLAEEVPHPSSNLPKAILAQFTFGFLSGFCYLIAILYGITDLPAVLTSTYLFPLTEIYHQAAATKPGTIGLLLLALLPNLAPTSPPAAASGPSPATTPPPSPASSLMSTRGRITPSAPSSSAPSSPQF